MANYIHYNKKYDFNNIIDFNDPIKTFLLTAGVVNDDEFGALVIAGFQYIALSHSIHGMNTSELVARLAGSVRTSYPLALISSICVRSGIYHGGSIEKALIMINQYLGAAKNENDTDFDDFITKYVDSLFTNGKLFGFGHRIHKNPQNDQPGADPRVLGYLKIIKDIFKDKNSSELLLIYKLINRVRQNKPSLGCNSDFAIALLCSLLDINENNAYGLFTVCRIPGFCARIIRELLGKANARRSPFSSILPYILPK